MTSIGSDGAPTETGAELSTGNRLARPMAQALANTPLPGEAAIPAAKPSASVGTPALGMLIPPYNAMQESRDDLVIMRCLGATRATVLRQVMLEGLIMAGTGTLLGIVLGHAVTGFLGQVLPQAKAMGLSGVVWLPEEW